MNPNDQPEPDEPLGAAYEAIMADLDGRQGRWRHRPLVVRLAMVGLPALVIIAAAMVLLPPLRGMTTSVWAAAVAAAVAVVGVMLAPQRPALGERFAQVATGIAVVAFAAELALMMPGGSNVGAGCLSITAVVALLTSAATMVGVASSGLPLRRWHRIGLAVAAVLGGCTAVWHHCANDRLLHVLVGHGLGPMVVLVVIVLGLGWRRKQATA